MSKGTKQDRSRRAFLTRAGGVAAALVAAPRVEGAQAPSGSASQPRDRGLWATWYDLPESGRTEHLAWLHETYIPALLKRPGYLWAAHYASVANSTSARTKKTDDPSVGAGTGYVLVVGGEDANVFGKPTPDELNAALPEAGKKMIAMRTGERTNVFAEASRITGPGAKDHKGGMLLAPCIQFGSYNINHRLEADILAWYAQLQMPNLSAATGCVRTRRLASVAGWAKMGILYEFGSMELRDNYFAKGGGGGPHKWTSSVQQLVHAPGSPTVGRRVWPRIET